ncbi:TIGR02679 family protein [Lentzea sp. DG1S-22]|uniref:TIGR02679 family protein n=1 Tax=Lentzea sp. DG1S-22 TaxID=3108822 RepID=UPI002E777934|nr:TIGR02679 family protein [Lentzea sp. DG1S-22]WVH77716.1 TIGR02679 family protein [Lentzea sp. DG1S-22]
MTRLHRLLGGDDLAWLVTRVRKRLERGEPLDIAVTLSNASESQRQAVRRLLGRAPRPGRTLSVSLPAVDEVLRRSGAHPDGLRSAVLELTGPLPDAVDLEALWDKAFAELTDPRLAEWSQSLRASGLVKRLAPTPQGAASLLAVVDVVMRQLPSPGEPIGRFAARTTGDAHALDDDRPLATLALRAARILSGLPDGSGAEWRREVWASVGLMRDELSTTVITLGLTGHPGLEAWLGQPVHLTLRQLVRDPPRLGPLDVFVCENPVVVAAAADHLGPSCPPLVCTSGQPGTAVMHLLRLIVVARGTLRYHGDFDWGGIRIANVLHDRVPFTPWRFDTAAYLAAGDVGRPLTGTPVEARWDPVLTTTMHHTGRRVEEELVLDGLLDDLSS